MDPSGWFMSEKLDGVRAYWNGRALVSRLGNPFPAPDWFLEPLQSLPAGTTIDGELFGGRGQFNDTVSIVKTANSPRWSAITYKIFDVPSEVVVEHRLYDNTSGYQNLTASSFPLARPSLRQGVTPFELRLASLASLFSGAPAHMEVIFQFPCMNVGHLWDELRRVQGLGGEGLSASFDSCRKSKELTFFKCCGGQEAPT